MFFSGDPASRRKVELRGRSNKEADRHALLNKVKDERERRQQARLRNSSALRIQKCVRGRRDVAAKRQVVRQAFYESFGEKSEKAGPDAFKPTSKYLPEFFYFAKADDLPSTVGVCRHFLQCLRRSGGNVLDVFTNGDYALHRGAINYRVKLFSSICLRALHHNRIEMKHDLLGAIPADNDAFYLIETILTLAKSDLPWGRAVTEHLAQKKLFHLLRELLLIAEVKVVGHEPCVMSSLEHLVHQLSFHYVRGCHQLPLNWSFPLQILSVPLLWKRLPLLKQVTVAQGLWAYAVRHTASSLLQVRASLPKDVSPEYPSSVCFLGNILEASEVALEQPDCTVELVKDLANVGSYLISYLPSSYLFLESADEITDEADTQIMDQTMSEPALVSQLEVASHPALLRQILKIAFPDNGAFGAVCGFLHAVLSSMHKNAAMTSLAYGAKLLPLLWEYIKCCQANKTWPNIELPAKELRENLPPADVLGWMLPLAVFCPIFSYLLYSLDNEEFYENCQPIKLDDALQLVHVLKEAVWQVLWVLPFKSSASTDIFSYDRIRRSFLTASTLLLTELHDRNSKRQFVSPQAFHAREAIDESFFQQAEGQNTKARGVLKHAPFLIPFTSRVRVYTAQLVAARQQFSRPFHRMRIKVQRDRIIEDAFSQINALKEDELKGAIRVSFVNELGLEEAGVDGGGIFKDFMESITKSAFDVQYGLFMETVDHLLYPNPASHVVHESHLQYFEFLGKILGKAMFEGILVDIPFAAFFLRKLKKKQNHLHDLPSLDPELYKNLLYLKNNKHELPQLGLYFTIAHDLYGDQHEVELLPGGKDIPVTEENVFRYIHLVANHRLNYQILHQSNHFLRGFEQLISPEWIDMFNEHELQVLISGSQEGMDIDDLRMNVNYGGGYHEHHPVIEMFWDILKTLDINLQRKFLKFVTGCSRGPLLGFKYLEPQFCIQRTAPEDAADETLDRLPTAATCMNLLKLPAYKSKSVIREKLLYAITAGAGFDLS